MSKNIKHEALELRIRRIFRDRLHPDHQDVLQEIFPEIYADVQASEWNNIHKVGHIYARLDSAGEYVSSLLVPVIIPHSPNEYRDTLAVLNLIAGNFWKETVNFVHGTVGNNYDVCNHDWQILFGKIEDKNLIHIGSFRHGAHNIYMEGKQDKIRIFKLDES